MSVMHSCREDAIIASVRLRSLVATSAFALAPGDADTACRALDVAWVSDAAAAIIVKQQYPSGHATRHVFVVAAGGYAAEVLLDDDEPCQLAAEIDGCVVLGESTWTLVRDVPMAVQRVCSSPAFPAWICLNLRSSLTKRWTTWPVDYVMGATMPLSAADA